MKRQCRRMVLGAAMLAGCGASAYAQASAIPSAQAAPSVEGANHGRKLIDQMITALGGDAWLHRTNWEIQGRAATFYKGQPHDGAPQFEEYYRAEPFGERINIISRYGVFFDTDHKDISEIFTADNGYEITFKGTQPLPAKDVEEYQRRHKHSLETVVKEWLQQPDVVITYEGTSMVSRHLSDQITVLTASNDAVTLQLDEGTHLPLSLTFQWRDPVYKDLNTDVEQFDDYHQIQGIMTPFTITKLHNGDMTGQRFVTKVTYNATLSPDMFDPTHLLEKKK